MFARLCVCVFVCVWACLCISFVIHSVMLHELFLFDSLRDDVWRVFVFVVAPVCLCGCVRVFKVCLCMLFVIYCAMLYASGLSSLLRFFVYVGFAGKVLVCFCLWCIA